MKGFYETAVILIGTLGWWGYVYPELSMAPQAYVQEREETGDDRERTGDDRKRAGDDREKAGTDRKRAGKQHGEEGTTEGILESLGNTGIKVGEIRIKSRIAEYVYQVKEETAAKKGAEDD